ncbi:hypothetical protein [Streptomyces sp. NBC_01497]|uniref:hypothetical protein n=1 Tax=Streptomyces sp. NBC_01497 TaxID=2903885 RepID=UPI002E30F58A|nr:hypothetical protein [Streptomyces sp. NBC_01497]
MSRKRSARSIEAYRSSPTLTGIRGAFHKQSGSTFHPAALSRWWRAAARPVNAAIRGPRGEADGRGARQAEQFHQPAAALVLDDAGERAATSGAPRFGPTR